MKQNLAVRSIVHQPTVMLFSEPTGLDVTAARLYMILYYNVEKRQTYFLVVCKSRGFLIESNLRINYGRNLLTILKNER